MGKFAAGLQATGKVNNHKKGQPRKIALRRKLIEQLGDPAKISVLDCYAGAGVMWRNVWREVGNYYGCDLEWKPWYPHRSFCTDNRRVLRCIDLAPFNLFDLDAYGSPWEQAAIIADRRKLAPGELIGLALTDGSAMRARMGSVDWKLADMAGIDVNMSGAQREWTGITAKALEQMAKRMRGEVVDVWEAEPDGRSMVYSAATLRGAT